MKPFFHSLKGNREYARNEKILLCIALLVLSAMVTILLEYFVFNFGQFRGDRLESFPEGMEVSYRGIQDDNGYLTPTGAVGYVDYKFPEAFYIYKFKFRIETEGYLPIHYEIVLDDKRQIRDNVYNAEIYDEVDTVYVNALTDELSFALTGAQGERFRLELLDLVYNFDFNPVRMLCTFVCCLAVAYTLLVCFRVFRLRLDNIAFIYTLMFGLLLVWLVPPRYSWDEFSHLTRVVYLVNGDWELKDDTISDFPYDYYALNMRDYRSYEDYLVYLNSFNGEKGIANYHLKSSAVTYVPIVYIVPFFGVLLAKLLNLSALYYVFLPRLCCLFFYAVMVKLSIRAAPANKPLFFFLALIPNTLFLSCGVNISAVQNGCLFYAMTAIGGEINHCKSDEGWTISTTKYAFIMLALLMVMTCRVTYAFFILLLWLLPKKRMKNGFLREYNGVFVFLIGLGSTLLVLYYSTFIGGITTYGLDNVYPDKQFDLVMEHPLRYIGRVIDHISNYLLTNRVGMDLVNTDYNGHLSGILALTIVVALTLVTFAGDPRKLPFDNAKARTLIFTVVFLAFLGTISAMYLFYTEYDSILIEGVQPRYIISLYTVLLPAIQSRNFYLIRKGRGFLYGLMFYVVFCYMDFYRILMIHFYS